MRHVLDVGQCGMDHGAIRSAIERQFEAKVHAADNLASALDKLREQAFDLVLVNRKLDLDDGDGLEVIRTIKADAELAGVPVMLVSNYPEYQQQAVAAGAVMGFGKAELRSPTTLARLAEFLA